MIEDKLLILVHFDDTFGHRDMVPRELMCFSHIQENICDWGGQESQDETRCKACVVSFTYIITIVIVVIILLKSTPIHTIKSNYIHTKNY
jgi:hypothetical protein